METVILVCLIIASCLEFNRLNLLLNMYHKELPFICYTINFLYTGSFKFCFLNRSEVSLYVFVCLGMFKDLQITC